MDLGIGQYTAPVIIMVILSVIYKALPSIADRFKPLISILVGLGVGFLVMVYAVEDYTIKVVIMYSLEGIMAGAAAVGIYEIQRTVRKPRD
jgi:uncharacterized membrane protein